MTTVFVDGACSPNPGRGGWAWWVSDDYYASGPALSTTNQRMELTAIAEAMRSIPGPLLIVTDSMYCLSALTDWWPGWERNGWVTKAKTPVKNDDLLRPMVELLKVEQRRFTFKWVKGHNGTHGNERADHFATKAALAQKGESRHAMTDTLATDMPAGRPAWDEYFLGLAVAVSQRADCRRARHGAVIVGPDHRVVSTGYNGGPPGGPSCLAGECPRAFSNVPPLTPDYSNCIALHAEQNAIAFADHSRTKGATIYITGTSCDMCTKLIRAAGITRVVTP